MVWFRVQGKGQRSSGKVNECPQYHASMRMNGYRVLVLIRLMLMPSAGVQADALWLMQTDAMVSLYILRSKPTRFFFLHPWHLRSSASTLASAPWRKLCDGLRRWCCSDTYQARYAQTAAVLSCKVFVMLQMKTRPHLFTTLSMRLPSSIGGDIQCIHQCLHLDCSHW